MRCNPPPVDRRGLRGHGLLVTATPPEGTRHDIRPEGRLCRERHTPVHPVGRVRPHTELLLVSNALHVYAFTTRGYGWAQRYLMMQLNRSSTMPMALADWTMPRWVCASVACTDGLVYIQLCDTPFVAFLDTSWVLNATAVLRARLV